MRGVSPFGVGVHLHRASYLEHLRELDTKLICHLITSVTPLRLREVECFPEGHNANK